MRAGARRHARILLTAAIAGYLALVLASGLDRIAATAPSAARLVPAPMRAAAQRQIAAEALNRGDRQAALSAARSAVLIEPVNPAATAMLGAARQLAGDPDGAEAAFRVAGKLGWRAQLTQIYWYDAALRAKDFPQAALRLDAVLRAAPQFPPASAMLAQLEADERGRRALAARLALLPPWADAYLRTAPGPDPARLRQRALVLLAAADGGEPLGCRLPAPITGRLLASGMAQLARKVWRAHCAAAPPPLAGQVADERFDRLAELGDSYPFGWRQNLSGEVSASLMSAPPGPHRELVVENSGPVSRLLLTQSADLPAGRYRFRADVVPAKPGGEGILAMSLDCGSAAQRPARTAGEAEHGGQMLEAVHCSPQTLGVWLRPAVTKARIARIWAERVQ